MSWKEMKLYCLFIGIAVFGRITQLHAQTILLPDTCNHLNIASHTYYFTNPAQGDSIPSADQFLPFDEGIYNFGKQDEDLWIRFSLKNQNNVDRELYLEFTNPNLNSLTLYEIIDSTAHFIKILGSSYPYKSRAVDHQNLIFPIIIQPLQLKTFIIKVHSDYSSTNFNLLLWDKEQRKSYFVKESTTISYFFFITTAFLIILGVALILTKEKKQWTFFFYILFGALYIYSDLGLSFKNLWGQYPEIQQISSYIFTNFYLILGVSFFREYFSTYRLVPMVDKSLRMFIICSVFLTFIAMFYRFIPYEIFSWLQKLNTVMFALTCTVILYILSYLLIRQRNKTETIWFMIAFAPHAYSILTTSIRQLGQYYFNLELDIISKVPFFLWTIHVQNMMLWSMVWEVLIVFVLMMIRFKKMYVQHNLMLLELGKKQEEDTRLLMATIEQERKRIAQELHDGSGVQLSAIKMKLTHLEGQTQHAKLIESIQGLMKDVDRVNTEIRSISHNLMPISLSKLGLKAAIQELVNILKASYPSKQLSLYQQYDSAKIDQQTAVHIYRMIQELLNNSIRHSEATEIHVQLIMDGAELLLSLEDNGTGFDYDPNKMTGLGLRSILTRSQLLGGRFDVDSKVGAGSFFSITLPIGY